MKTKTRAFIDKQTAESFDAWVKVLKLEKETALYQAFDGLRLENGEEFTVLNKLRGSKKKYYPLYLDPDHWVLFKNKAKEYTYSKNEGVEIAMHLFVKHYDNKLSEVL